MRTIDDFNFKEKKVLIRVDFNVPLEKGKVTDIAKGLLPKKRGRPPKKQEDIQELLKKKRKAGIKQVTQIKQNFKKKNED